MGREDMARGTRLASILLLSVFLVVRAQNNNTQPGGTCSMADDTSKCVDNASCVNVTSEAGDMTSGSGNVTSEGGNVTSSGGNVTSEGGNVTSGSGNVTSAVGNVTLEGRIQCACNVGYHVMADSALGTSSCQLDVIVGGACTMNGSDEECVKDATCMLAMTSGGNITGLECSCMEGYHTVIGDPTACEKDKAPGSTCLIKSSAECVQNAVCQSVAPAGQPEDLQCVCVTTHHVTDNAVCQQDFDPGQHCSQENSTEQCVDHATCTAMQSNGGNAAYLGCTCDTDYHETHDDSNRTVCAEDPSTRLVVEVTKVNTTCVSAKWKLGVGHADSYLVLLTQSTSGAVLANFSTSETQWTKCGLQPSTGVTIVVTALGISRHTCDGGQYGPPRCSLSCGQCQNTGQCHPVTGHCLCAPGFYPPLCNEDCKNKTYGVNCSESCGQCKGGQPCNPTTGVCATGCEPGYMGELCKTTATAEFGLVESEKTGAIRNLSMAEINKESLPAIVNTTKAVLRENTTTSALDVILIANILKNATKLSNIPIETATDILEIVEIVAGLNETVLEQSNAADNATNRVLQAVESLGDSVSLGESGSTRIQTNNTVLQVWNLTTVSDSHVLGLELALDSGEVTEVTDGQGRGNRSEDEGKYDNTDTAIMLPGRVARSIAHKYPGRDIRISASIFTKTSLFRSSASTVTDADSRHRHITLNSKVIALRITVDGKPKTNLAAFGKGSVTTVFTPVQSLSKEQLFRELSRCVFWDFALQDGKGAWSEEGCHHSDTVQGKVVCECDHLTNFAVLLDLYGQENRKEKVATIHESALSLISVVGLCLSIAGLSGTVISFIVIKKLHSSNSHQTLFNMALAMLLSWVTFLAGFLRVHGHASCILVAALLHYLILVSFMWMVIEGILLFLQFKARIGRFSRYMLKTALPAWGLPLIPVIIILAIDVNLYNGGEQYCWMSRKPFYYAFLAPIAIMVSTNIVLYVLIVVSICRRRDMSHGGTSYNVISIRASIASFVVLGLSWVFAFFAIEDARLVFQYLFTCTTAFQGILIFAIFTARDAAVRQFWLDLICRCKKVRSGPLPVMQSAPYRPVTKETSFNRSK